MKVNMGTTDRVIRLFLATVVFTALYLTTTLNGPMTISAVVLGLSGIVTCLLGVCPLYLPFRLRTNRLYTPTKKFKDDTRN